MSTTPESAENKLSTQLARREVNADTWNTLQNTIFPGAAVASILMAVDYCKARKLDILKKPVHIVPMPYKDGREWKSRDVVMPGINEIRTTAMRTGQYAGIDRAEWGAPIEVHGVKVPESCTVTVYRIVHGVKAPFPATVYFEEACGTTKDFDTKIMKLNAMWARRPRGQLEKCAEAAALRKAFPEEIGNEYVPEEVQMVADTASDVHTRTVQPGEKRTSAAAAALQEKLGITNEAGTGALDTSLKDLGRLEESRKEPPAEQERKTRQGEWDQPAGNMQQNRRDGGRYDVVSAVAALKASTSLENLLATYQMIDDDYSFSAREMPVDIEANYMNIKEAFETGQRK